MDDEVKAMLASGRVVKRKNGVLQDTITGRFVAGGDVTTAIATPQQGREVAAIRYQRKRERLQAGALSAVETLRPGIYTGEGDDWIEAIGEAVTMKALDRLDPQQVNAAKFLFVETGLSEDRRGTPAGSVTVTPGDDDVVMLVMRRRLLAGDVVDTDVVDVD